ncbi:MAG: cysteine--tRNA ligase [Acidobacteriota bacterium]
MPLKVYNTLTKQLEEFVPLNPPEVRMYTCGPTVYHYVHIGNFRTFVFQDILRRYLRYLGFRLFHVMNITDVEDKIIAAARREGVSIQEYTRRYEQAFLEDMATLRIEKPEMMPRATEHIEDMIRLIQQLEAKGLTYRSNGSVYFRIAAFSEYGKLSGFRLSDLDAGRSGRVDEDEYSKEDPRDFVLWKAHREGEAYWDSPFGKGRPGWHIECSTMSMKYLGESFDIHCGGVDLVFPHHENEIAQSEGATGKPFVRYWLHCAHLIVEGQKMSKSLGNFYTLRDLLERGCRPDALRYLLGSVHYRKPLNFTFEGVQQAEAAVQRINDFLLRVRDIPAAAPGEVPLAERIRQAEEAFEAGMNDDLNTSAALAALFELVRDVNPHIDRNEVSGADRERILDFFRRVNDVFACFEVEPPPLEDEEILQLIRRREEARDRRDFATADAIRERLRSRGILLEDTKQGTRWKRVN